MKRSLVPVIYDFKRSFLRISTLVLLVVFIVAGVALSYLSYTMISSLAGPVRTIGLLVIDNSHVIVYGIAYDFAGKPLHDATLIFLSSSGQKILETKVSGTYKLEFNLPTNTSINRVKIISNGRSLVLPVFGLQPPDVKPCVYYYATYDAFPMSEAGGVLGFSFNETSRTGTLLAFSLLIIDKSSGEASLQVVAVNTSRSDLKPHLTLLVGSAKISHEPPAPYIYLSKHPISAEYHALTIDKNIVTTTVKYNPEDNYIIVLIKGSDKAAVINVNRLQPAKSFMAGSMLSSSGLSLFLNFFPIVFLYLAYVMLAKPKATGALEFILARPVTKWDLYMTRFLSGILVALVSSAIFVVALDIASLALWGITFSPYVSIVMFLALFVGLTAWYSFCYMIASGIKSSSGYLAVSIVLYLLFAMFWGLIVFLIMMTTGIGMSSPGAESLSYKVNLLNPIKISDLILYYMRLHYGLVAPISWINPAIVAGISIVWIIVPFIIGYLLFKRD